MQGHLWSETSRTSSELEAMIFPRLLGLAERAWHKAGWEAIADKEQRNVQRLEDWTKFANTLGYKELDRLDGFGVNYRVPLPGSVYVDNVTILAPFLGGEGMFYIVLYGIVTVMFKIAVE